MTDLVLHTRPQTHRASLASAGFASGVRLLTETGSVAVERLGPGARLVTSDGALRAVVRLGQRRVDRSMGDMAPVRIAAHAFGPNLPTRPVLLAPDQAVFMYGVLVPARALIDGGAIASVPRSHITYWSVELDEQTAVLAENLPCESHAAARHGRHTAPVHDEGPIVDMLRRAVSSFAAAA